MATAGRMLGATGARNLARLGHLATIGALLLLFGCEMPFQTGSIRVTSTPPGARVFFDGSDTGRVTPYTIPDVSAGSHTIRLTLDGHSDWGPESVAVAANETATVNVTLTPAETSGSEYGLGLELLDLQAYQSAYILRADPTISLPSSIDIGVDFPSPRSQGGQGSCVGWAVAYALKSYHERIERGWPLTDERNLMSPAYVYNQIKLPGGGAYFTDALNLLIDQGVSSWSQMPYNPYDDRTQPSAAARAEAANYRIADWGTVQRTTHAVFVEEIKRHLAAADPVLIGVPVYPDFVSLSEFNPVYDDADGAARGYHAIVIVGYDDARSAFKVINSWGTDWGIGGYGWIDYEASRSLIRSAYVAKDARPSDERPEAVSDPRPADGAAGVAVDAVLRWTKNARTTSFDVYVGTDRNLGAADFQGNVAQATFAPDLAPGSEYYWRIDARGAGGVRTGPVWSFTTAGGAPPHPSDERPEPASDPRPVDGAAGVAVDAVLRWTKNARTTSFDVYVGTDRNLSADFQGNVAQATFAPDLARGSKYYWRIDARGAGGVRTGPVWSFTTAGGVPPQPPAPVSPVCGSGEPSKATAVDRIYWTGRQEQSYGSLIRRAHLDGSNVEQVIDSVRGIQGFALDATHGAIYWTEIYEVSPSVTRIRFRCADLDGSNGQILVSDIMVTGERGPVGSVYLDMPDGKVYWVSLDVVVSSPVDATFRHRIQRANLDGSSAEILLTFEHPHSLGRPSQAFVGQPKLAGLALDTINGKMYWAWSGPVDNKIQRANLDGSNVENLYVGTFFETDEGTGDADSMKGIDLDIAAGKMYWTSRCSSPVAGWCQKLGYGLSRIRRANLDGSNVETLVSRMSVVPSNINISRVDLADGKMYWLRWSGPVHIERADLDGSNAEILTAVPLEGATTPSEWDILIR